MSKNHAPSSSETGLEVNAPVYPDFAEILTLGALAFVEKLVREFTPTRDVLLQKRSDRQKQIAAGTLSDF